MKRVIALLSVLSIVLFLSLFIGCSDQNTVPTLQQENDSLQSYQARQNEIALVNLSKLAQITEQIIVANPQMSDENLRASIFDELATLKKLPDENEHVLAGPYIPGISSTLTWAEFWLLIKNPRNIQPTDKASNDAIAEAKKQWHGVQLNTKADAFRHAYWNILLAKRINIQWAKDFTIAHESEPIQTADSREKPMDLHNNEVGRNIFQSWGAKESEQALSTRVKGSTLYVLFKKVEEISRTSGLVYFST